MGCRRDARPGDVRGGVGRPTARSSAAPLRSRRATPGPRARRAHGSAPGSPAASSRVTASRSNCGSTKEMPRLSVSAPWASRYGLSTAAVKFSQTPSCMILTLVAAKRPPRRRLRWSIRASICSRPWWRSHQSAPTTRAVSSPDAPPACTCRGCWTSSSVPTMASCQAVMPREWRYSWPLRRPSARSSAEGSGAWTFTRSPAPSCRVPGLTLRVALDPAVGRVGRIPGHPADLEREGVDPCAVAVPVGQVDGAVGHDASSATAVGVPPSNASMDHPPPRIHGTSGWVSA